MLDETSFDALTHAGPGRPFDRLRTISRLVQEAFLVLALAGVLVVTVVTAWLVAS